MVLFKTCPMCNKEYSIELNDKGYKKYKRGEGFVQDLFPELDAFEREFVKSGYCSKCQEMLFNTHYEGHLIQGAE